MTHRNDRNKTQFAKKLTQAKVDGSNPSSNIALLIGSIEMNFKLTDAKAEFFEAAGLEVKTIDDLTDHHCSDKADEEVLQALVLMNNPKQRASVPKLSKSCGMAGTPNFP